MRIGGWDIPEPAGDPATWDALLEDVIGRVAPVRDAAVAAGVSDPESIRQVEGLCAAAVLARLWREVRPNVINGVGQFVPQDVARRHGLDLVLMQKALRLDAEHGCNGDARDSSCNCANIPNTGMRIVKPAFREAIAELIERTRAMLVPVPALPADQRTRFSQLRAETLTDLRLVRRKHYDTLTRRPVPGTLDRVIVGVRKRFSR